MSGPGPSWWSHVARLAAFLTCLGLATSRIGLIAHEFVGHGGAAVLAGGDVLEVHLFWFAGGWIRYHLPTTETAGFLFVAMGGIAIELVIGAIAWLAARGPSRGARIIRGLGATFVIHALWYLATGAWHGFGDGMLLHRELGDARPPFAIGVGLLACGAAYLGARGVLGAIAGMVPGTKRATIIGVALACVVAAAVNLGVGLAEVALRRDATYTATMRPERDRLIAGELARWTALQRERVVTQAEREAELVRLETRHPRRFPFAWVLGTALVLALGLGGRASTPGDREGPVGNRLLARTALAMAIAVVVVIAIDRALN